MMSAEWRFRHDDLSKLFSPGYAGYKPDVREAPNSDGRVDEGKRYLHVALKYDPPEWARDILACAHFEALQIAERIGVPDAFYPRAENGTLRVLEYSSAGHDSDTLCMHCGCSWFPGMDHIVCPALGASYGTAEHTDFDLFTVNLWRSTPEDHEHYTGEDACGWFKGTNGAHHVGRIGELVGLGPATLHRVPARPYAQRALVYFAMPANSAPLPITCRELDRRVTVNEWLYGIPGILEGVVTASRVYK